MFFEVLLPIAGVLVNPFLIIALGVVGGFFSSFFGIGSGIVMTPFLIMVGIPPFVAVTSQLHASIGTNFMGFLGYWRKRDVDFALAWYLFIGGFLGSIGEIFILDWLESIGSMRNFLGFTYVGVLIFLGILLVIQNIRSALSTSTGPKYATMKRWMVYIPYHKIFTRSRVEMSMLVPIFIGFITGILTSTLGGGNSVFIMPIVSYLIGRSSPVVAGTSLLAGALISISVTLVHAVGSATGDFILISLIILGSYLGTRIGITLRYRTPRNILSIIGGFIILLIAYNFAIDLPKTPIDKMLMHSYNFVKHTNVFDGWFYAGFLKSFSKSAPLVYSITSIAIILVVSLVLNKLSSMFESVFHWRRHQQ